MIENIGSGTVRVNDLDRLLALQPGQDGQVTRDDDGLQIWVDGESFPLVDPLQALVAQALAAQLECQEAQAAAAEAGRRYAVAVTAVVARAGSAAAAATALDLDLATVTRLLADSAPAD